MPSHDPGPERRDLAVALARLGQRPGVEVAVPAGPVRLPGPVVEELVAAVGACLDNVERHVPTPATGGPAPAWVLLEALPDRVEVSVRDDGPGIAEGRLEEAGRRAVSGSAARCAAGWPTSVAPRPSAPDRAAPSGSWSVSRRDHPRLAPLR